MPQSKEVHRDYMRKRREGSQNKAEGSPDRRTQVLAEALIDPIKRMKLIRLCSSLDKDVTLRTGQRVNLETVVRYGIGGFTFKEIAEVLI